MTIETYADTITTPSFLSGSSNSSYYRILNVAPEASKMMIREAYLRMKNLYQQGSEGLYGIADGMDVQRQNQEIEEAFSVLNDDFKRAAYDRSLGINQLNQNGLSGQANVSLNGSSNIDQVSGASYASGEVIQTSRSTLRVIRTRANRASDAQAQEVIAGILAESDLGDGSVLGKLRQALDVSEAEMQERTKISLEYIRSMEANRFERLPQVVYVKGFMRSYLRYLCVPNSEEIIKAFAARLEAWQQGLKQ